LDTVIVLAMHGAPPNDFPQRELSDYFRLHAEIEAGSHHGGASEEIESRYAILDTKMRAWPRNNRNDPFHAGSFALATELERQTNRRVLVGFNEFCAPSLEEAFERAREAGALRVVVITPMMTAGGSHAELDIPLAIKNAQTRFPDIEIIYAWPFERREVASFLAVQLANFLYHHEKVTGLRN